MISLQHSRLKQWYLPMPFGATSMDRIIAKYPRDASCIPEQRSRRCRVTRSLRESQGFDAGCTLILRTHWMMMETVEYDDAPFGEL